MNLLEMINFERQFLQGCLTIWSSFLIDLLKQNKNSDLSEIKLNKGKLN